MNENGFRSFVKKGLATEDYQKAIADETITKCIEEAKTSPDQEPAKTAGKCDSTPLKASMCVHREFFNACPIEMQDQSEKCANIREMENSGKFDPRGHGLGEDNSM